MARLALRRQSSWLAPVATVVLAAIALWLAFDVSATEVFRYLGYQAGFVLLPGWLAYRALPFESGGRLRQLAFGWVLGYALSTAVYMAAAALDARNAFLLYPLIVAAITVPVLRRRPSRASGNQPAAEATDRWIGWAIVAICLTAFVYLAGTHFVEQPMPGTVDGVDYDTDGLYWLSIAGEAKHHWPITNPIAVGEPLRYHVLSMVHMAAASDAGGVELATILLRLDTLAWFALLALLLTVAGQSLGGRSWIGPLAAALVLLTGELDLDSQHTWIFENTTFIRIHYDPPIAFSLIFFLPAITMIGERLSGRGPRDRGTAVAWWALLSVFLLAAGAAKSSVLPVIGGGLVLVLIWHRLLERRLLRPALAALVAVGASFGALYVALYSGGESGFDVNLRETTYAMFPIQELLRILPSFPGSADVYLLPLGVLGTIGLLGAVLVGVVLLVGHTGWRIGAVDAWLLALLATGVGAYQVLAGIGSGVDEYFFVYGFVAGGIVAARGLHLAWESFAARNGAGLGALVLAVLAWGALLTAVSVGAVTAWPAAFGELPLGGQYALEYGALILTLAAVLTAPLLIRRLSRWRAHAVALALAGVIAASALDTPLDVFPVIGAKLRKDEPLYIHESADLITSGTIEGGRWIREHTNPDAVLAINHATVLANDDDLYFAYTAFAERRALLEGWNFTRSAARAGVKEGVRVQPFPRRLALQRAVFLRGDEGALRAMARQYHVTHLVVDKVHGEPTTRLPGEGLRRVFANDSLEVYAVTAPTRES